MNGWTRKPGLMGSGHSDEFQTPPEGLTPLLPFLPGRAVVWEPAAGKGRLAAEMERHEFRVIASDLHDGRDFLHWQPDEPWDLIVTNPPYSIKDRFLGRCYQLGKPFALLMPLTALESRRRQALYREHGLELILFPYRVHFDTPSGRGAGSWFASAWFTWGLGIGRQLTFWEDAPTLFHQPTPPPPVPHPTGEALYLRYWTLHARRRDLSPVEEQEFAALTAAVDAARRAG